VKEVFNRYPRQIADEKQSDENNDPRYRLHAFLSLDQK
jgi:hypothetical protein